MRFLFPLACLLTASLAATTLCLASDDSAGDEVYSYYAEKSDSGFVSLMTNFEEDAGDEALCVANGDACGACSQMNHVCCCGECLSGSSRCGDNDFCSGDCGECCEEQGRLFGLFAPSDHCFSNFISPITNPVFFEDPRTLTEARIIYLNHSVPNDALGGDIDLIACQLRFALTDRLSVIATKDGFIMSSNPLIQDGWADISAGLKYNLYADYDRQRLLSAGLTYEMPVGSRVSQQGNGDGLFNLFLSGGAQIGDYSHWISASGFLLPADRSAESSLWFWSNHFDHEVFNGWYALAECNWYHYMGEGRAFTLAPIEGGDLFNLGSVGVAGNDIVTGAFGLKYKPSDHLELGVAWEAPLTDRRDVLDNRLTVDCILRY